MPLNGSGGVTQATGSVHPAVAGTLIESAKHNITIADIYTILASALYKDGQQTATQRIPFAQGIQTDSVTEKTSGAGVTLDGVLLKDGRIDTTQGADIVCAATINLETATGNVVDVTGSTGPVTAITLSQGHWRLVRFTGTPTLTNGASLVLPNAADYTVTAGDYILFVGYASSVVRAYIFPTSGPIPFLDSQPVVVGATDKTKKVRFEADGLTTATTRVLTVQDKDGTIATTADIDQGAQGWINGLTLSNNAVDAVNDIDIAAGGARDSTNVANLILASALTKQIDVAWAVGTNQGGLDGTESVPGTPDNDTWYYVWLIQRSDTGVVDALFSESSSAPTMPTGYDRKRLIGAVRRGTATNLKFYQDEGWFRWQGRIQVVTSGSDTTNTAVTLTPAVPPIAASFSAQGEAQMVITNVNARNVCIVQVAASVDYAALVGVENTTSGTGHEFQNYGSSMEIPNTGVFNYRNAQSNTTTRFSNIFVTGFKLTR